MWKALKSWWVNHWAFSHILNANIFKWVFCKVMPGNTKRLWLRGEGLNMFSVSIYFTFCGFRIYWCINLLLHSLSLWFSSLYLFYTICNLSSGYCYIVHCFIDFGCFHTWSQHAETVMSRHRQSLPFLAPDNTVVWSGWGRRLGTL